MKENTVEKRTFLDKFMDVVERACNKLPPPAILFCILFAIVAVLGAIFTALGTSLTNPATGEVVMSKNLFTEEGLHWFLDSMVSNFTGYAPLGLVLCMTLGTGICEESGLLVSLLRSAMRNVPGALVPYVCVFIGIYRKRRFRRGKRYDPAAFGAGVHRCRKEPDCRYDLRLHRRAGRLRLPTLSFPVRIRC